MKVIGLTGGIGSGKSTVSRYLMSKGYEIIDADQIARELVLPHTETLGKIQAVFGKGILLEDDSLNRKALAEIIFSNADKKLQLEGIMHSAITQMILQRIEDAKVNGASKAIFVDVPLLFESGLDQYVNQVWVVDVNEELRMSRVIERDGSTPKLVKAQINNQMSREEKNLLADVILDNSTSREKLYEQIEELLLQL